MRTIVYALILLGLFTLSGCNDSSRAENKVVNLAAVTMAQPKPDAAAEQHAANTQKAPKKIAYEILRKPNGGIGVFDFI